MDGNENILVKTRYWGEEIQDKIIALPDVHDIRLGLSNEMIVQPKKGADIREELSDLIMQNGWGLLELRPVVHDLEEVFLRVISSEGN